jgi:hypothetical protein
VFTRREEECKQRDKTFQAEVRRRREEECKRRETRDLRSGRGASLSRARRGSIFLYSVSENLKRMRKAGNAGYAVAIMK